MQGNKKGADGFSDTSSIGSVLDEADREVSSLTDRAFRSLCVSEDTSFSDSDLALSPDTTRQVFGNFRQGTVSHTQRKSGIWSQLPSQGTEHAGWAATFQQLPKYVQGEEEYPQSSPPLTPAQRRLEVPVSGLRSSSKPISKVSSLIKSFDRTEGQQGGSRAPPSKPPAIKNPPKFAPLPESSVNFCFDSAFLTVRRVPAEVSSAHQNSHQPDRKHAEQESPESPEMACQGSSRFLPTPENGASSLECKFSSPPRKPAAGEPGSSREWARKGTFLHSENSAFESWSAHHPKLLERKDPSEAAPENKSPKHYEDKPLLREPQAPECKVSPCQPRASCGQEENRLTAGTLYTSGPRRPRDPGAQVFSTEEKASSPQPDLQVKSTQPPWRKPKARKGGKESTQDGTEEGQTSRRGSALYTKHAPQGRFPENDALDNALDPNDCYNPPFNIRELLTPIIPTKHVLDPPKSPPVEVTPSPPAQLNGYQEQEPSECPSRDSYKAKAPSLLFNLKDVRKRVKSTYTPSPLLKGLDEKSRGKQEPVSNGALPNGLEESPPEELSKERPANTPSLSLVSTQRDPKADPGATSADDYLTLSLPPAVTKAPFCVNGEAGNKSSYEKDATEDSDLGATRHSWSPDSRERCPRKHLALKLCSREPEVGGAAEPPRTPSLENGVSRSISQETEPEREAGLQNPNFNPKVSPGPLSPEEEDVFYSDSQSDFVPDLKSKAKFSTSSSDQSFASFEDQQKTWFAESQREDGRSDMSQQEDRRSDVSQQEDRRSDVSQQEDRRSDISQWEHRRSDVSQQEDRRSDVSQREDRRSDVSQREDRRSDVSQREDRRSDVSQREDRRSDVSQWEHRRSDVSAGDGRKDSEGKAMAEDGPPHCALGSGPTCVEEQARRGTWQAEGESACGERARRASREEADFRGTWIGSSKDTALSQAKGLTPSPSSTLNRHRLFAIKDNTLRATPVIKPVMLPLLRALSSEDALGGGHKAEELPRTGWGEEVALCAPKSQEMPGTPTPTGMRGPPLKHVAHKGMEDHGWVSGVARMETKGTVSSTPLLGEGGGLKPPPEAVWKVVASDCRSHPTDQGRPEAPRGIPVIALPESDIQGQPPPQQLATSWEEQTQDFNSRFLSTPRAGPPGRRLAAGEPAASPNSSSLEGSSAHSPAASSAWDDASQGPSDLGLMSGEPSCASPRANPSPSRVARREDLTHAFSWEASADPQLEPSAEDRRTLSPGDLLLDVATSSAVFPEKAEPSSHLERAAAKPPAVPPKTEKALRRAKKLASKRRKIDQAQEGQGRAQEEKLPLGEAGHKPLSAGERLLPRLPAVRALPPPVHRHSVATFSDPVRRWPGGPQALMPLLPYPATQKVLQDPQSGEYFVFDLPLQVKIKTFYDPETGKYVKVPIPSSEEGSPEPLPPNMLAAPYMLYPGIRPLPATALMPLRCSSQLSNPTFLRQDPGATEATQPGPQSTYDADLQPALGPPGDPTQHTAGPGSSEPPRIPGEGVGDTPSLGIISTNDLEDFATEDIS